MLVARHRLSRIVYAGTVFGWALSGAASADVFNMPSGQTSISFVSVGNPGNASDPNFGGNGSVDYTYNMSKFETTVGQYTQFLNAVAVTDTYGLYHTSMANIPTIAGIARSGSPGSYSYSPIGSPNKPIAAATWADAARFANWLTNGQPSGNQDASTTEDGSYFLNGANTVAAFMAVTRKTNAQFVIPTADEWYKAAYYDPTPGAGGGDNYWLYPMRTDAIPYSDEPPGTTSPNSAFTGNFYRDDGLANGYNDGYAVSASTTFPTGNALTDVGTYTYAASYYGTFDQGGNLTERNETFVSSTTRGVRGGIWGNGEASLRSSNHSNSGPLSSSTDLGFRIAEVPEPSTALLLLAALPLLHRRRTANRCVARCSRWI